MGQTASVENGLLDIIEQEFLKVKSDKTRDYLMIKELLQFQSPENYTFTFNHIGNLYVLDSDRSGQITLAKLHQFAQFCHQTLKNVESYEFSSQLQAATSSVICQKLL